MKFAVDFASTEPKVVRPELLTHPHIPSSMAGVNPRTILGREWWDVVRKQAYLANNYNCCACGGNPSDRPLDAHEVYRFDYVDKTMTFVEVVALCKDCHAFIHSGCLHALHGRKKKAVRHIICDRTAMLVQSGLEPFYFTFLLYREHCKKCDDYEATCAQYKQLGWPTRHHAPVQKPWTLVIGNKTYGSDKKEIKDDHDNQDAAAMAYQDKLCAYGKALTFGRVHGKRKLSPTELKRAYHEDFKEVDDETV